MWDAIVVGAGIEGSATAYHLAKNGRKTLLLEQFPLPHSRGSSHGQSRITRKAYGEDEHYTKMMFECFRIYDDLEKATGMKLFENTGLLFAGPESHSEITATIDALKKFNVPNRVLNQAELHSEYPMLSFDDKTIAIMDKSGGVLYADKLLQAFQKQFVAHGGTIYDQQKLLDIMPGDVITLKTTSGTQRSKSVVLTLGPWAKNVLPSIGVYIPLKVLRISVLYWKERQPGRYGKGFPTFLHVSSLKSFDVYGLPSLEYPGLFKLCLHHGPEVDPDRRDDVDSTWVIETMCNYVEKHFPGLEPKPALVETCIYTNTPDHDFVLDTHPVWKNLVIGAGFSGHGFKLSPNVGKVLAELALGNEPSHDLHHFRLDRFLRPAKL